MGCCSCFTPQYHSNITRDLPKENLWNFYFILDPLCPTLYGEMGPQDPAKKCGNQVMEI
jgi:hypothetical protein